MPRPKGLGTESYASVLCAWAAFLGVLAFGLVACFSYADAQTVNHDAKVDLPAGKSYHRICELTEADNIEIINRRLPGANIIRFDGGQAKLYTFFLQNGYRIDGQGRRLSGGYGVRFPNPDRLYIVDRIGHSSVYPFFVVDGCVARQLFQIPRLLHRIIIKHMKAHPA